MTRTQIQLTEEQYVALKERARRENLSLSAAVRAAVDHWLRRSDRKAVVERSIASLGRFRSGRRDIAARHDEHLAEIYSRSRRRGK